MSEKVKRYDCTNGGAGYCQGCYQMTRDDEYGDYVEYEDYAKLQARIDALEKELAPLEGRSVLDTVKYVSHLESRVVELAAQLKQLKLWYALAQAIDMGDVYYVNTEDWEAFDNLLEADRWLEAEKIE